MGNFKTIAICALLAFVGITAHAEDELLGKRVKAPTTKVVVTVFDEKTQTVTAYGATPELIKSVLAKLDEKGIRPADFSKEELDRLHEDDRKVAVEAFLAAVQTDKNKLGTEKVPAKLAKATLAKEDSTSACCWRWRGCGWGWGGGCGWGGWAGCGGGWGWGGGWGGGWGWGRSVSVWGYGWC